MAATSMRFPSQIKYIVGNEAAERFSYYGMRAILFVYMTQYLVMDKPDAGSLYHLFVSACYLLPLFGAWLSDRFLGKYRTIMTLSVVYCLGHLALAIWENRFGLDVGLALIALGAGGIKPCVSAHVGDQFNEKNQGLLSKVFDLFYFSINFGAFFSTLLTPWVLKHYGPSLAFGIPGVLMGIATLVFWMGKREYVHVPPTGKTGAPGFAPIFFFSLRNAFKRHPGTSFWSSAQAKYKPEEVDGAEAAWGVFKLFIFVSLFWALFDQQGSSWVDQASQMNLVFMGHTFEASQIQALNPIMVMALIPFFSFVVYPWLDRMGFQMTALRRMCAGMLVAASSFAIVAVYQSFLDGGTQLNVAWHFIPYLVITCAEVMVSISGLEFAYTQAPRAMKSTIMSFWLLTVFVGNILVAYIMKINGFIESMTGAKFYGTASFFWFFAMMMFGMALAFTWAAKRYRMRNYIESGSATEADNDEALALAPAPSAT